MGLKTNVFATTEKRGCARESERGRGKAKNSPKKCPWKIQIFAKTGIHGSFFVHGRKRRGLCLWKKNVVVGKGYGCAGGRRLWRKKVVVAEQCGCGGAKLLWRSKVVVEVECGCGGGT